MKTRSWTEIGEMIKGSGGLLLVAGALLVTLLGIWIKLMLPEWSGNPDLSHGFFTPILFILLINEARNRGPNLFLSPQNKTWGAAILVMLLSIFVLLTAALFAAAIEWGHPRVLFLSGGCVAGALASAWIVASTHSVRIVPFNWIVFVAILLWLLSVPLPPGTYSQLTLGLQLWVSDRVLQSLHLLGIPAIQNGNIIELARTTVGVEDACSGVRSLLSCIYAGFFFSANFVRRWKSRCMLIVLAPIFAIGMNFVRSLFLTLLANGGVDIAGTWHDATGYAILGITALILGALAMLLERIEATRKVTPVEKVDLPASAPSAHWGPKILIGGYSAAALCLGVFMFLSRPAPPLATSPPDVATLMPEGPQGWKTATSNGLVRFADILETDQLAQRTYVKVRPDGEPLFVTLYLAYWQPGQAGVSVVATHTPDACWPGAGWTPIPVAEEEVNLDLPDRNLARSEYRIFTDDNEPQHVWFWHSYDRQVIPEFEPRRPLELLGSVFTYGVRSNGEQLFVRLSSNLPWEEFSDEPLITEIFANLKPFGL
ncbi:exosortase-associated EpsI family protein [bacterium]|nr:exosortase-associated EpsI family protein [bacterium]